MMIIVEFRNYPTFPLKPCTRRDRDLISEYKEGINFEFSLWDKKGFLFEQYLADTKKNGESYLEVLELFLAEKKSPIEIKMFKRIITDIKNLNKTYSSGIRKCLEELFLL